MNFIRKIMIPGRLAFQGKPAKAERTMVFTVRLTWVLISALRIPRCKPGQVTSVSIPSSIRWGFV